MTTPAIEARLSAVETSIYRIAHDAEVASVWRGEAKELLTVLEGREKAAIDCRNDLRNQILDLKQIIIDDKEVRAKERAAAEADRDALSNRLVRKIKTATVAKIIGGVCGTALLAVVGTMLSPETLEVVRKALEAVQ
jgi:hypothetical protein